MKNKNYFKAKSYLYKFSPIHYQDWVHDAFIKWYDKTGKNLFDEDQKCITQVLKYIAKGAWQGNHFMYRGVTFPKAFYTIESDFIEDGHYHVPVSESNPETICVGEDLEESLKDTLSDRQNGVLLYLSLGYSVHEVSEILGITTRRGYKVQDQIKEKSNRILSEQY